MRSANPLAYISNPEALVSCPYNESHRVSQARLQFHLVKCKKAYPMSNKKTCPFNTTHIVNEQEYRCHVETCPQRGIVDTFMYQTPTVAPVALPVTNVPVPPSEENWDNEISSGTYDPSAKVSQSPIIHSFIGGTKSERKKVKLRERQKFQALEDYGSFDTRSHPKKAETKQVIPNNQPLRPPTSVTDHLRSGSSSSLTKPSKRGLDDKPLRPPSKSSISLSSVASGSNSSDDITNDMAKMNIGKQSDKPSPADSDDFVVVKSKSRGKKNYNK